MAWQDEMTTTLRYMILDISSTQTYSDDTLQQILVIGAQLVEAELDFTQVFRADVNNVNITPDPTDSVSIPSTRDDNFINLVCMRSACIIDRGEARNAAAQAVKIRDGSSSIDLQEVAKAKLALLNKGGWCSAYEEAKTQFLFNKNVIVGAAVMTPFRVWAGDGRSVWPNAGFLDFRP